MIRVRKLCPDDAEVWRQIRLEGLKAFPDAFLTQYVDIVQRPLEAFAQQLEAGETYAAFDGDAVIGCMGAFKENRTAVSHRAVIGAVYVQPAFHGNGVAEALLTKVIDDLPERILQLHLEVAADNGRARAFYERHGFKVVGTLPRAVFKDGIGRDDLIMVRMLDA